MINEKLFEIRDKVNRTKACEELADNLIGVYEKKKTNHTAELLNDIAYVVEDLNSVLREFNKNSLHPEYALEKLKYVETIIDNLIEFYEEKGDEYERAKRT